jgi:hypothetical protein
MPRLDNIIVSFGTDLQIQKDSGLDLTSAQTGRGSGEFSHLKNRKPTGTVSEVCERYNERSRRSIAILLARHLTTPVIVFSGNGDQFKDLFLEIGAFLISPNLSA